MVSQSFDKIERAQKVTTSSRDIAADLDLNSTRNLQSSPLSTLSSSHPIARQFAALEINIHKISEVIDTTICDPSAPLQRAIRESVKGEGISIDYLQSKNAEATLKIVDEGSGTTLHFCWGAIAGENLLLGNAQDNGAYLNIDVRSTASDSTRIILQRIDGSRVVSLDETGVRVCSSSERQEFLNAKSQFLVESDRAVGAREKASAFIHALTAGRFGNEIETILPVELPGKIIPHETLLKHYAQLNQMLEKTQRLLTPTDESL